MENPIDVDGVRVNECDRIFGIDELIDARKVSVPKGKSRHVERILRIMKQKHPRGAFQIHE
jgi:hypothetical protein